MPSAKKDFDHQDAFPDHSLKELCLSYREIVAAYVFGSQATGEAGPRSDVDVAVLLDEDGQKDFDSLQFMVDLEKKLERNVDLVVLNHSGEPIKHQVRRDGRIVFDRDPRRRKHWEIMSTKFYQDFLHLHAIYMQGMKKALKSPHGG
ncbi:MAG: nucleotidyltransferase domain-containing protein [Desulfohalobiaceae bacterium]|nr:nucleotidyltransferase domain-containing protein [Desulfohalobiaceae bacterium]